jgi:hypothetical protein
MKLIGIMGAAGAGKDSTADIIAAHVPGVVRFAFATRLRKEIAEAFGIDQRVLTDRALKDTPLEQLALRRCTDPGFGQYAWELSTFGALKPRTVMQRWGDYQRQQNPDHYIAPAESVRIRAVFADCHLMVATDVRFENEAAWVRRNRGELWRIVRPNLKLTDPHASERELSDTPADVTIVNAGPLDDLRRCVIDLLTPDALDAA